MGVYFGETEITNIDNLVPQAGQDITQAFFGSTEVFTVWAEYDGTLPATYSANGSALADYRIYGAAGGVGDETESGEPNGYKIPIGPGKPIIYGFRIDPNISNSYNCVTYLEDAVGMTPASMGSTAFDYGSWKNVFFMPRPCMLKYDGTVDYYLDPNDYTKKVDGTASDISNYAYNGNAMMEFPKIWFKFVAGVAEGEGYFYVSNQQVDDSYHCWANYDSDGNQTDHFYMSIYNGVIYDGKMRSLSGKKLSPWRTTAYSSSATYAVNSVVNYDSKMWKCVTAVETAETFDPEKWEQFGFNGKTTGQQEVDAAVANDTTVKSEWYIDTWCDRVSITTLLYLMGKSLDLQSTYGRGIDSGSQTAAEAYITGAANDKGLFYGVTANGNSVVKVFGIENFWALKWRRTAGCIGKNDGTVAYKMTSSTADGSTATAYNTDGTGYLIDNTVRPANGYVSKMGFGAWGLIPRSTTGGNSNVYYCDYFFTNNTAMTFALVGGCSADSRYCGFFVCLDSAFAERSWIFTAALSCKPCSRGSITKDFSNAETVLIYIGSDPLGEDEYVDYGEGKIYRMIDGTLTPTDPPVPLPALPTVDGVTITDYAGQSAAVPSRFVAKYRKEGF